MPLGVSGAGLKTVQGTGFRGRFSFLTPQALLPSTVPPHLSYKAGLALASHTVSLEEAFLIQHR